MYIATCRQGSRAILLAGTHQLKLHESHASLQVSGWRPASRHAGCRARAGARYILRSIARRSCAPARREPGWLAGRSRAAWAAAWFSYRRSPLARARYAGYRVGPGPRLDRRAARSRRARRAPTGRVHSFDGRSDRARYLRHMLGSRIDEAPIAASRSNIDFIYIYIEY